MTVDVNAYEAFKKEFFIFLDATVKAEREACAKVAEQHQSRPGQIIARRIRDRPPFALPPIAFEVKNAPR